MNNIEISTMLKQMRKKSGLSASKVVDLLKMHGIKISSKTLYGYESGLSMLNADTFVALCEIYNCEDPTKNVSCINNQSSLSSYESELINKYRYLDNFGKEAVELITDHEYNRCLASASSVEEEKSKYNVITLLCSEQTASAGKGTYLGVESFNKISVLENELTKQAHFAVPVSGNSMEPLYHDGDILLVKKVSELHKGEIGVFTLDGEGYVKELGNSKLISLNPAYKPISLDHSVIINGKVIGILKPEWIVN